MSTNTIKCKYCKDTGTVFLFTSSYPCIDCDTRNLEHFSQNAASISDLKILFKNSEIIQPNCDIILNLTCNSLQLFQTHFIYAINIDAKNPNINSPFTILNVAIDNVTQFIDYKNIISYTPIPVSWNPGKELKLSLRNDGKTPSIFYIALWGKEI